MSSSIEWRVKVQCNKSNTISEAIQWKLVSAPRNLGPLCARRKSQRLQVTWLFPVATFNYFSLEVTFLTCVWQAPVSNLGRTIDYLQVFLSSSIKCRDVTLNQASTDQAHITSNLLFIKRHSPLHVLRYLQHL